MIKINSPANNEAPHRYRSARYRVGTIAMVSPGSAPDAAAVTPRSAIARSVTARFSGRSAAARRSGTSTTPPRSGTTMAMIISPTNVIL